ncbi:MAG: 4a-hydroxytetrahydrobiopterin dehydratase [Candidatus Velthaea sp.]
MMAILRMSDPDILERLKSLPEWKRQGKAMSRTYDRGDFNGSITFVIAVANAANEAGHHPDIMISWNQVKITTWSHDAGGITERDFALAAVLDAL